MSELSQPFDLGVVIRCGSSRIHSIAKRECHENSIELSDLEISNHSGLKKRLLSRYMIMLGSAPGYAWQYLGNVGPAGLVNRTALGTGEIALCPGRMYWDPQTEKGQLRTQGSRFP